MRKETETKKINFDEFMRLKKISQFKNINLYETYKAYADCFDLDDDTYEIRNLDYFSEEPIKAKDLIELSKAIGNYNYFKALSLIKVFKTLIPIEEENDNDILNYFNHPENNWVKELDNTFDFHFAREGSPCLYIKVKIPTTQLWISEINKLEKLCDECSINCRYGQVFLRLWWD